MAITEYYDTRMAKELGDGVLGEYPNAQADSKVANEAINFGVPVQLVSGSDVKVENFSGGTFYGIALARKIGNDAYGADGYETAEPVSVLRKGTVWVTATEAVAAGQKAVLDNSAGTFLPADTAVTPVTAINAQFKTSADAGDLALLEVLLPA